MECFHWKSKRKKKTKILKNGYVRHSNDPSILRDIHSYANCSQFQSVIIIFGILDNIFDACNSGVSSFLRILSIVFTSSRFEITMTPNVDCAHAHCQQLLSWMMNYFHWIRIRIYFDHNDIQQNSGKFIIEESFEPSSFAQWWRIQGNWKRISALLFIPSIVNDNTNNAIENYSYACQEYLFFCLCRKLCLLQSWVTGYAVFVFLQVLSTLVTKGSCYCLVLTLLEHLLQI